jgi:hypothetical protein
MTETPTYAELDEDRCYYGNDGSVVVQGFGSGWTERENKKVLRVLAPLDPVVPFNWGYIGSGSNQVAIAILADALGIPGDKVAMFLYQDFTADFVSQFPDEFRIRRFAVLRWVRGVCCDKNMHDFPAELPPADPYVRRSGKPFGWQLKASGESDS